MPRNSSVRVNATNKDAPGHSGSRKDAICIMHSSTNGFTPEVIRWYEEVLGQFPGEQKRKSSTEADVICPVHDDHDPSLGVDLRQSGAGFKVVINCRSRGCEYADILKAVGLSDADLEFNGGVSVTAYGCTLDAYAASKNLPLEFLTSDDVALEEGSCYVKEVGREVPAVEIPYADQNDEQLATRYRISPDGDDKFRWERGSKTTLYGLHKLEEAHDAGYVLLVEGESDCHTAWYRGLPAVGVPGVDNWRDEWAEHLNGIPKIFVVVEPDGAGKKLWLTLVSCKTLAGRLRKVVI
jgi:putative DNA primase/helicase